MKALRILAAVALCAALVACGKSLDEQMREYVEFYYPSTGEFSYDIGFDWGSYLIITHAKPDKKVHPSSEKYRGYITMRPHVTKPADDLKPLIYLTTPKGVVWTISPTADIPKKASRKEVTVTKRKGGTMTQTRTINSPSEPIIDHFLARKPGWTEFGKLEKSGDKYKLKVNAAGANS